MTLIPWKAGRLLVTDVTIDSTLAESYVEAAAPDAGEVAELAETSIPSSLLLLRDLEP